MQQRSCIALALALAASTVALGAQDAAETTAAAQFAAIKAEFAAAMKQFQTVYSAAKSDAEKEAAFKQYPDGSAFAGRVKTIAEQHPEDAVAAEAIVWVLQNGNGGPDNDALLDILLAHHGGSPQLAEACRALQYRPTPKTAQFLRAASKSPSHEVQGWANYVLAKSLESDADMVRRLHTGDTEGLLQWLKQSKGDDGVAQMRKQDADAVQREAEALLEQVAAVYTDVKSHRGTLADIAKSDLFELRNLSVGKTAPDIEGKDVDGQAFKLSDYRGKVVFLDFWGYW